VSVPQAMILGTTADGRFGKEDFIKNAEKNEYRRSAAERVILRYKSRSLDADHTGLGLCQQRHFRLHQQHAAVDNNDLTCREATAH